MDWTPIIEHNRDALLRVAATVLTMLTGIADRVPRSYQRYVLRLLIPAESALRRLIVIAARGLVVDPPVKRERSSKKGSGRHSGATTKRKAVFHFIDIGRRLGYAAPPRPPKNLPRIWSIDDPPLVMNQPPFRPAPPASKPKPKPDGLVDAHRLLRRLEALTNGLNDIPGLAKRLALWRLRSQRGNEPVYTWPLRGGPPPGHRRKAEHEVDHILADCHAFAYECLRPDTS